MKVSLSIFERVAIKIGWAMSSASFAIGQAIHKKYDPDYKYNTHTFDDKSFKEMIFTNDEDES